MEDVEVKFIGDVSSLVAALEKAEKKLKELGVTSESSGKKVKTLDQTFAQMRDVMQGPIAAAEKIYGAIVRVGQALDGAVMSAAESQASFAKISAILKSTGRAAGVTTTDILNLSDLLAETTLFQDEDIMHAEEVMLTFTKIGKEVFPRTLKAATDMSAVLGMDLQGSVTMLGKALQDPINGFTALKRIGVSLTATQGEQIKVLMEQNDLLGAQKIILQELETEYGGAAEAVASTATGAWQQLKKQIGEVNEGFGKFIATAANTSGLKDFFGGVAGVLEGGAALMSVKKVGAEKASIEELGTAISYLRDQIQQVDTTSKLWQAENLMSYGRLGRELEADKKLLSEIDIIYEKRRLAEWQAAKDGKARADTLAAEAFASEKLAEAQAKAAEEARKLAEEIEKQYKLNYAKQLEDIAAALGFVSDQAKNATDEFVDLNEAMGASQDKPKKAIDSMSKSAQGISDHMAGAGKQTNELSKKIKDLGSEGTRGLQRIADAVIDISTGMAGLISSMADLALNDPFGDQSKMDEKMKNLDAEKEKLTEMEALYNGMSEEYKELYLPTLQAQRDLVASLEDQIKLEKEKEAQNKLNLENLQSMGVIAQDVIRFISSGFTDINALLSAFTEMMNLAFKNDENGAKAFVEKLLAAGQKISDAFASSGALSTTFKLMENILSLLVDSGLLKALFDILNALMMVLNALMPILKPIITVVAAVVEIISYFVSAIAVTLANIVNGFIDFYNAATLGKDYDHVSVPAMPTITLPKFASGVQNFEGGAAVVGEQGPELVTLPRGSNVYPADTTAKMLNKSATVNIYSPKALDEMTARTVLQQTMRRMALEGVM